MTAPRRRPAPSVLLPLLPLLAAAAAARTASDRSRTLPARRSVMTLLVQHRSQFPGDYMADFIEIAVFPDDFERKPKPRFA